MSTKNIEIDFQVFERLSSVRKDGESFSKLLDRLLAELGPAHTGETILQELEVLPPLSNADSKIFLNVMAENRADERWAESDLR